MVNISKKKIKKEVLININNRLIDTIYRLNNKKSLGSFIDEILSHSEKIMVAKRLAIIFMLYENISWNRIHEILGVSIATVKKISNKVDNGEYEIIQEIVDKKKNREIFWLEMESLFSFKIRYRNDKNRWDFLNKYNI